MTRAIVFATAPAADGGMAAALRLGDSTPLERLIGQLEGLDVHVIARPMFASALDSLLPGVTVHVSEGQIGDLGEVAAIARGVDDVVVLPGELVTQPEPLDRVGPGTALLTLASQPNGTTAYAVRAPGGQVLSAASPYHWVGAPSAYFGEVLRADGESLAEAAERSQALPETEASDVPALLAAALVRGGTPVQARDARTQFWARPTSKNDAARTQLELSQYDEDRARLDAAVKANDGFFTTFFVSPYSRFVARFAARIGATPNQVTVLAMLVGILAALAFAKGERWSLITGAVLLQVAFMLDCVDGQLARYTRNFSRVGAWLDSVFDRGKEFLVYAGLAIGSSTDVWVLAAAALSLQTVRHMFEFSYWDVHYKALAGAPQPPLDQPGDRPGPPPGESAAITRAPAAVHDGDGMAQRTLGISRLLDRPPGIHWIKKMIVFPIGERFAAISITAALFTPRVTFITLLVWGGIGGIYSLSAHLMHTIARRSGAIDSEFVSALRDDGLLAREVAKRVHIRTRFNWLVPGTIRTLEYGLLILTAALAGGNAMRSCFALLAVLAFHHYDTVYRLRQQGAPPPAWVSIAGGGWDGRIILAFIALAAAVTTAGMAVAAALLAVLFGGESVASWIGDEEDVNG